jgi:D-aminopeptidase
MADPRRRARDLGLTIGPHDPGPLDAITDVAGVRVGHTTVIEGDTVRTGVTAIVPDGVDRAGGQLACGLFVGNGYGKLVGATQLVELGVIETPIVLTGTLSAFRAADALVTYMLGLPANEEMITVNPVVGETNDGYLSDIRSRPVTQDHVLAAITGARDGAVAEGCVGAGTGTAALGFKAGIGTASRLARLPGGEPCMVGALVQSNFSGTMTVRGVPILRAAAERDVAAGKDVAAGQDVAPGQDVATWREVAAAEDLGAWAGNSCMIVVAVGAGLDARQLTRVAKRAVFAMGRTGADFAGTSGDYAISVATGGAPVPDAALGPVFGAAGDAVEEAILNSVFMATTTVGFRGHVRQAVPLDYVVRVCRDRGVLGP